MTVCYAYDGTATSGYYSPCEKCGHWFWRHSHRVIIEPSRTIHEIIPRQWALHQFHIQSASLPGNVVLGGPDIRPRYQMMMDRQPGTCAWVKARMHREEVRRAYKGHFIWPLPPGTPIQQEFGTYDQYYGVVSPDVELQIEAKKAAGTDVIYYPATFEQARTQTEPVEVTTWHDMMQNKRRWLMPDGTTFEESNGDTP